MIRYAMTCAAGHGFEAWFRGSEACDEQISAGLIECPSCATTNVRKAPMAPSLRGATAGRSDADPGRVDRDARPRKAAERFEDVGPRFAAEVRAMHDGRAPEREIRGEATVREVIELVEDGIGGIRPVGASDRSH